MNTKLKLIFLSISRSLGLFRISSFLTRKRLQILCYHGFVLSDEACFRPKLFIEQETFRKRLDFIKRSKFEVVSLSSALKRLQDGTLPDHSVVITIDDGFYSVYAKAAKILKDFKFPATVYITTYYVLQSNPIFRLVIQYIFWKSRNSQVHIHGYTWAKDQHVAMNDRQAVDQLITQIIEHGENLDSDEQRQQVCAQLGELLSVDYEVIKADRILSLMSANEIKKLKEWGFDIQLHTHRHRLPADEQEVAREIQENRGVLFSIIGSQQTHFCYPSGIWDSKQWPWLHNNGVESATTCVSGMNDRDTPLFALNRFLDGENIQQIEFEAELFGFLEVMRILRSLIK